MEVLNQRNLEKCFEQCRNHRKRSFQASFPSTCTYCESNCTQFFFFLCISVYVHWLLLTFKKIMDCISKMDAATVMSLSGPLRTLKMHFKPRHVERRTNQIYLAAMQPFSNSHRVTCCQTAASHSRIQQTPFYFPQ